jgi:spore maturation protein CgeB
VGEFRAECPMKIKKKCDSAHAVSLFWYFRRTFRPDALNSPTTLFLNTNKITSLTFICISSKNHSDSTKRHKLYNTTSAEFCVTFKLPQKDVVFAKYSSHHTIMTKHEYSHTKLFTRTLL